MIKQVLSLLLFFEVACCYASTDPLSKPATNREISIMTYNVKLLPRGLSWLHHHPVKRARLIPAKLISEGTDVIVFEEAFDRKAIGILRKGLSFAYPYMAGSANRKLISYKRAGGVLIFSKYPLKEIESVRYSQCKGMDCYGNKGAMLVEVEHPVQKFQLLGTHLQAGGGTELKNSQYVEMSALLRRHEHAGMPQFVAGDFNTHKDDTTLYPKLIGALKAEDADIEDEDKMNTARTFNDMRLKNGVPRKKAGLIDYVFIKENGVKILSQRRYAQIYQQAWSAKHKDLSDHFAVILKVTM